MRNRILFALLLIPLAGILGQQISSKLVARGAQLEMLADGFSFTEGPATDARGNIYFTDQPNNRIHLWDATTGEVRVFMEPSGRANGLYFMPNGRLLAAADGTFALWEITSSKKTRVLASQYEGKDFNGPNDIWVHPGGGIFFTDPYYQRPYWERKAPDMEVQAVYYLAPNSELPQQVEASLVQPNGIIGTPDGKFLYIADIGGKKTFRYAIDPEGKLSEKTLFADMGSDGMTLDRKGNLYLTGDGVHVFDKKGNKILHIPVPENWTANVTFGGLRNNMLFITAMDAVYGLRMRVKGAGKPKFTRR